MRLRATLGLCLGLIVFTAGCSLITDSRSYREGIGTDLSWEGLAEATRLQNVYLGHICRQAGLGVARDGDVLGCAEAIATARDWGLLVQAGMNDIDLRCDAYLGWLDDKKRSAKPLLQQISDMRSATGTVLDVTGAGPHPITIVGTAFGLAANTFTNVNSRLLLEVNHSTVQSVVLNRRNTYRMEIARVAIDSRPAAVHALRSYLNICMPFMPFTIEMEINTTVTAYEKGGIDALDVPRLITPDTVKSPTIGPATTKPGTIEPSAVEPAPKAPRQKVARSQRPTPPENPAYADIIDGYKPAVHTPGYVAQILEALCAPAADIRKPGPVTKGLIRIFEAAYRPSTRPTRKNGKLDANEIGEILGQGSCKGSAGRNYFERRTFTNDAIGLAALSALVEQLKKYNAGAALQPTSSLAEIRDAIGAVRQDPKIGPKLGLPLPKELSNQMTHDLFAALMATP